jgi:hypothetical protein
VAVVVARRTDDGQQQGPGYGDYSSAPSSASVLLTFDFFAGREDSRR